LVKNLNLKNLYVLIIAVLIFSSCYKETKHKPPVNPFYKLARSLEENDPDSAFINYNRAKDKFLSDRDSLGVGKSLVNMGVISNKKGDYYGAQEISLSASKFFKKRDTISRMYLTTNYNNLGMVTHQLKDYNAAIKFFDAALHFSVDSVSTRIAMNNKAKSYESLLDYKRALVLYNAVLRTTINNKLEYARTLTNITNIKWLRDQHFNPVPSYLKALKIREKQGDLWGQNSSYSHLSDYYQLNNIDSSFFYALKMYHTAIRLESTSDQLGALQKLIRVAPMKNVRNYFDRYEQLSDSLETVMQNDKNQFALVRYEIERHKSDLLRAKAENIQKKNDILRRNIVVCILISGLLISYFWFRRRQKSMQQEKELEVKNTEIKYVKAVHDQVANQVYQVMSEVDNSAHVDREDLLDRLDGLYQITRDISYNVNYLNINANYAEQLSKMFDSYRSNKVGIVTVGNEDDLWCDLNEGTKFEIYYILLELLTNMKKHSKADSVVLKFRRLERYIQITYIDNGVGMTEAVKKNGLSNTENRIKLIRGTINFDSSQEKEFIIDISFPFSF
jgi:tetratricopeptide (TPR) repeat protein